MLQSKAIYVYLSTEITYYDEYVLRLLIYTTTYRTYVRIVNIT